MASPAVREALNDKVRSLATFPVYDLSEFNTLEDVLGSETNQVVLIQYVISDEELANIGGEGNQGWEEIGTVTLHVIGPVGWSAASLLVEAEKIRLGLRGYRLDAKTVIESASPFVDYGGDAVQTDGSWHGFASSLTYVRRDCG